MIADAVVCPHPPLLFRELVGQHDVAAGLRGACRAAVTTLLAASPDRVVVVGGADEPGAFPTSMPVGVRRFGTTGPGPAEPGLPLSLGVGRRLLGDAGWAGPLELLGVAWDASAAELDRLAEALSAGTVRTGLLLLGDGSARRGEKAPGFLDDRAFPFDDSLAAALATGDRRALHSLDGDLARDLMVGGRSVFRLLGRLGDPQRAELRHRDDPFGVSYFVACWSFAG